MTVEHILIFLHYYEKNICGKSYFSHRCLLYIGFISAFYKEIPSRFLISNPY